MVFSSIVFLFAFLPIVLTVYYVLKPQLRNIFLLIASLFFYYWGEPKFLIVMVASILWNYLCGINMNSNESVAKARPHGRFRGLVGRIYYFDTTMWGTGLDMRAEPRGAGTWKDTGKNEKGDVDAP